jgi:hypothetical protein
MRIALIYIFLNGIGTIFLYAQTYSDSLGNYITFLPESKIEYCFNYGSGLGPYKLCGCSYYRIKGRKLKITQSVDEISNCNYNQFTKSKFDIETTEYKGIQLKINSNQNEPLRDARIYYYDSKSKIPTYFEPDYDGSVMLRFSQFPKDSLLFIDCLGYQPIVVHLDSIDSLKVNANLVTGNLIFFLSGKLKLLFKNGNRSIKCRFVGEKRIYFLKGISKNPTKLAENFVS